MSRIAGIKFENKVNGEYTHVTIDLRKWGDKILPFFYEIGALPSNLLEKEFEEEWAKALTKEEMIKKTIEHINNKHINSND
ncbi:MAG: hypothetical protein GX259_03565 [Bacteroidales bacterium]|jgi:hypothetical protein|nr:hypothetical protein [Bacteroidales bacterium]NLL27850.1 hypothetical protein [Bacteroidales bacterium]